MSPPETTIPIGMVADDGCDANTGGEWQSISSHMTLGYDMSFQVHYRDPTTQQEHDFDVDSALSIGREPDEHGLTVSSASPDFTISSNAVKIRQEGDRVVVHNTSSYALLEIIRSSGALLLAPQEQLTLAETTTVVIPGETHRHEIAVTLPVATPTTGPLSTRSVVPTDYEIPEERREVLAHLCAPVYYPKRFSSNQTAREIARRIKRNGSSVTAKEVNNKVQRTKNSLEEQFLTELADRQELAAYLVEHQLITKEDVDSLVL